MVLVDSLARLSTDIIFNSKVFAQTFVQSE